MGMHIIYFKDSSAWHDPKSCWPLLESILFCSPLSDRTKEVSEVGQNTRLMNKNKTHCNGGLSPLLCQHFKKKATSMEAVVEFKHSFFN